MHTVKIGDAISQSAEELHQAAGQLQALLTAVAQGKDLDISKELCVTVRCPCRKHFRETLIETINTLDETKKSFKSKKLAELRQKLIATLASQDEV